MANIRVKDLPNELAQLGDNDYIPVEDMVAGETKKIKKAGMLAGFPVATPTTKGLLSAENAKRFCFPFTESATGGKTITLEQLKNFIVDCFIDLPREGGKTYSFASFGRNDAGTWYVYLYSQTGTPGALTYLAGVYVTSSPENGAGITVHDLLKSGEVKGRIAIRWSAISEGAYDSYYAYNGYELHPDCWQKDRLRNLRDYNYLDPSDKDRMKPAGLKDQTKPVVSITDPVPDYLGQIGKDSTGKHYVAVALAGGQYWLPLKSANYPFKASAVGGKTLTLAQLRDFIIDCSIDGAPEAGKTYSFASFQRNDSGTWAINLYSQTGSPGTLALICAFSTTNNPENGDSITVHDLIKVGVLKGKIAVNWSKIPEGAYSSYYDYNGYGLSNEIWNNKTGYINDYLNDNKPRVVLPDIIYCAIGRELNLWKNTVCYPNTDDYHVDFITDSVAAKNKLRCFRYTPTILETISVTCTVRNRKGDLLFQKGFNIASTLKNNGSGTKQALFIGDSLTNYGYISQEVLNLVNSDGGFTLKLLGTQGDAPNLHEGRSGWKFADYLTGPTGPNGYTNSFWDAGNSRLDFKKYMSNNSNFGGTDTIDFVFIQMGINDIFGNTILNPAQINAIIDNAKALITAIHDPVRGYPSCKVIIGIPPIGNDNDGFSESAYYYANYSYYAYEVNMRSLWEALVKNFDNDAFPNTRLSINGIMMDKDYAYGKVSEVVSARNDTVIERYNNGVHPGLTGYYQIADAYYSVLRSLL
jgi:lysophospholipase L1-like esterase